MATLSTRGRYWVLNWTDATGQRHRHSIGRVDVVTKREAEQVLRAKQREIEPILGFLGQQTRRAPSFGEYARDYLAWHEHEYGDSHYRVAQIVADHLLPAFEFDSIDMIEARKVEQYKRDRLAVAAVGSVTKELRTLQAIVNRAVREEIIQRNPIQYVQAPRDLASKPHRWYTADELVQIYAATVEPWHAPAWRLFANTGMRRMEGLHLRWRDVGTDGVRILSTGEERTKSGEWRDVPLSRGASDALEQLRGRDADHVLPRIAPPSLSRAFVKSAGRAGLDGSLHTLRHTYISHLVMQGVPLRTVQIYAGHAHYTTTEGYAYLMPSTTPAKVRRLAL